MNPTVSPETATPPAGDEATQRWEVPDWAVPDLSKLTTTAARKPTSTANTPAPASRSTSFSTPATCWGTASFAATGIRAANLNRRTRPGYPRSDWA